jgi:hypothetical protein
MYLAWLQQYANHSPQVPCVSRDAEHARPATKKRPMYCLAWPGTARNTTHSTSNPSPWRDPGCGERLIEIYVERPRPIRFTSGSLYDGLLKVKMSPETAERLPGCFIDSLPQPPQQEESSGCFDSATPTRRRRASMKPTNSRSVAPHRQAVSSGYT